MTEQDEPIILDKPDKQGRKPELLILGIISLSLLAAGLLFQSMHWPGYLLLALSGFLGMTVRYLILFFRDPQSTTDWFYLGGRVALLLALAAVFYIRSYSFMAFLPAMILFFLGIISVRRDTEDKDNNSE